MAEKVIMPKQGLQMTEGTIHNWIVKEGESCEECKPLFEMETDKLIDELLDKKSGMVSLARQELRCRYIERGREDKEKIALAFAQSSLRDNNWLESQMRKELYGVG